MFLTISTTKKPATDLGFLLHKHPDKVQSFAISNGTAFVFYPEATEERTTVALLLDIDPVGLARNMIGVPSFILEAYINDRPYTANSYLSTAIATVFRSAIAGICKERPELVSENIPLEIALHAVKGGRHLLELLFEPLGYTVEVTEHLLDNRFPDWGKSPCLTVKLKGTLRLSDALRHLFILIPVLDNKKHYWIGEEEVDKLLEKGGDWFTTHPARELITKRYQRFRSNADRVLARLSDDGSTEEDRNTPLDTLWRKRLDKVTALLLEHKALSIIDLGCGDGKYLARFMKEGEFKRLAGMDVSHRSLELAADRLGLDELPDYVRKKITLFQGSLTYHDPRIEGYDAAIAIEVIEHMEQSRLDSFERAVFVSAAPRLVIITTPNREYNAVFERLEESGLRYADHRFEWTRAEFEEWALNIAARHNYSLTIDHVGEVRAEIGARSQLALFIKNRDEQWK